MFFFAENIALLAETALRFLELVQLKNLNMENEPTGEEMDETSHPSDNYDTGNVASTYPACLEQQIMGQSLELGLIFLLSQSLAFLVNGRVLCLPQCPLPQREAAASCGNRHLCAEPCERQRSP